MTIENFLFNNSVLFVMKMNADKSYIIQLLSYTFSSSLFRLKITFIVFNKCFKLCNCQKREHAFL